MAERMPEGLTLKQQAKFIFDVFEVLQSYSVKGFTRDEHGNPITKGKVVLDELKRLYTERYMKNKEISKGTKSRRRNHLVNTVGGTLAHPIWRYKEEEIEGNIKVSIWRIQ